jgi:hypothetical protein
LYKYVSNSPISKKDPIGLRGIVSICAIPSGGSAPNTGTTKPGVGHCWIDWQPSPRTPMDGPWASVDQGTYGTYLLAGGITHNWEKGEGLGPYGECTSASIDDAGEGALAGAIQNAGPYNIVSNNCCKFANDAWEAATGNSLWGLGGDLGPTSTYNAISNRKET